MRASLEPWISSSVEREDEGRGATAFFRMGLGRLGKRDDTKKRKRTFTTNCKGTSHCLSKREIGDETFFF